jgi:hypothetical protein
MGGVTVLQWTSEKEDTPPASHDTQQKRETNTDSFDRFAGSSNHRAV